MFKSLLNAFPKLLHYHFLKDNRETDELDQTSGSFSSVVLNLYGWWARWAGGLWATSASWTQSGTQSHCCRAPSCHVGGLGAQPSPIQLCGGKEHGPNLQEKGRVAPPGRVNRKRAWRHYNLAGQGEGGVASPHVGREEGVRWPCRKKGCSQAAIRPH